MDVVGKGVDAAARRPQTEARLHQSLVQSIGVQSIGQVQQSKILHRAAGEEAQGSLQYFGQIRHFGAGQDGVL